MTITLTRGLESKPNQYVNTSSSYFLCKLTGEKYFFNDEKSDIEDELSKFNFKKGIPDLFVHKCKIPLIKNLSTEDLEGFLDKNHQISQDNKYFKVDVVQIQHGNWTNVLKTWCLGILMAFFVNFIVKNSLLYIVYGQKFNLDWEKKFINKIVDILMFFSTRLKLLST